MERIDDLQLNGLRLIQDTEQFCFGVDAVLLAHYASHPSSPTKIPNAIVDLCCGNGIVPILLSAKTTAASITGLEIQPEAASLAQRNVELNNLSKRVNIICGDLRKSNEIFEPDSFDLITCNPPYKEYGGGIVNASQHMTIARHEVSCTLEDIIRASVQLLKPHGRFCMIHRPERLVDILTLMRSYRLEPKRLRFVHPSAHKTANLILVEGVKYGKPKLFLDPPLYVHDELGNYTSEINEIYERSESRGR